MGMGVLHIGASALGLPATICCGAIAGVVT
jgi:hypothetical protein